MIHDLVTIVKEHLAAEATVQFAYLFGSAARNETGPLSDLDVALYLEGNVDLFAARLHLMEALAKRTGSERFDLIVLNKSPIVLKFEVVKHGVVLKEDKPRRVDFETRVLQEYLDSVFLREIQYGYLKESLKRRCAHGQEGCGCGTAEQIA